MNLNKVLLAGNLTRDPELKSIASGFSVCQFGIAVNRKWKDANGQPKEEVFFADCQAWGKTAEVIVQYFKKGSSIFVEGRLRREEWDDAKGGGKRSATRIVVDTFQFVGGKKEEAAPRPKPKITEVDMPPPLTNEDDVPF